LRHDFKLKVFYNSKLAVQSKKKYAYFIQLQYYIELYSQKIINFS